LRVQFWSLPRLRSQLALDFADELEVEGEKPAEKGADEDEALAPVRKRLGTRLGLLETVEQIGDVLSESADPPTRRRLADQLGDQQTEE
jgi:hypothetical protein